VIADALVCHGAGEDVVEPLLSDRYSRSTWCER